jgi:hypothetical protein
MKSLWNVIITDSTDPKHDLLKAAMQYIILRENKATLSIWVSISAALTQTHLKDSYTIESILLESYYLGLEAINKGEIINHPIAWLRWRSVTLVQEICKDSTSNNF